MQHRRIWFGFFFFFFSVVCFGSRCKKKEIHKEKKKKKEEKMIERNGIGIIDSKDEKAENDVVPNEKVLSANFLFFTFPLLFVSW